MNDLRHAIRQLRKSTGFTALVVLTPALGIGANTSMFSITNGLLLRPLPVHDSERLVTLFAKSDSQTGLNATSYPDYRDLRDWNQAFEGLAAHFDFPMALRTKGRVDVVTGHIIPWNYLEVLGVSPVVGRAFLPEAGAMALSRLLTSLLYDWDPLTFVVATAALWEPAFWRVTSHPGGRPKWIRSWHSERNEVNYE